MKNKHRLASVKQESDPEDVLQRIPLARWIKDPQTWDKYTFINEVYYPLKSKHFGRWIFCYLWHINNRRFYEEIQI